MPMVSPMPNLINDIGKGVDRLLRCKRVHPCFLLFFLFVAGCAISTGVVYLVKGPGEIIQIALFSLTLILLFLLIGSHTYYIRGKQQTSQEPENV
jgi:hypothetical protein